MLFYMLRQGTLHKKLVSNICYDSANINYNNDLNDRNEKKAIYFGVSKFFFT